MAPNVVKDKTQDVSPKVIPMESNPEGRLDMGQLHEAEMKRLEAVPAQTSSEVPPGALASTSLVSLTMRKRMLEKLFFGCTSGRCTAGMFHILSAS